MAQRNPSKITTDLSVDDPLVIGPGYRIDDGERRYLDNQIRGIEQHLVDALIRGRFATWVRLDGASAAVTPGDNVCDACAANAIEPTVTKAVSAALTNAKATFGVVIYGGSAGSMILVATGGMLPPSLTSLGSTSGFVRVNTTTSKCERVATLGGSDYPVGTVGSTGWASVAPFPQGTGGGGGGTPGGANGSLQYNDAGVFNGIAVGTTDQIIKSNGTSWVAGALNLAAAAAITGILALANGGTGASSIASGIVTSNGSTLSSFAPGTGVQTFLTTPSSANLAAAVTDETGSGALVFANTPTLVTPAIGAATGTSVVLTSFWSTGATPATTGAGRLTNDEFIYGREGANNRRLIGTGSAGANLVGNTDYPLNVLSSTGLGLWGDTVDIKSSSGTFRATFDATSTKIENGQLWVNDGGGQYYKFAFGDIAAHRTITYPVLTGNDVPVFEAHAQSLSNKTSLAFGSSPATTGVVRMETSTGIYWNSGGTNYPLAETGSGTACYFGTTAAFGGGNQASNVNIYASSTVAFGISSATYFYVYSPNASLEAWKPLTGSDSGSSPHALSGRATQAMADANQTAASSVYMMRGIKCTGTLTAQRDLTLPLPGNEINSYEKVIENATSGGFGVNVKCSSGTTVVVAASTTKTVFVTPSGVQLAN